MEINEARECIYKAFKTAWDLVQQETGLDQLPHIFENADDDGVGIIKSSPDGFVRVSVRHETNQQIGFTVEGQRPYENYGRVWVQLFTPLKKRLQIQDKYAQYIRNIYHGKVLGGANKERIRFYEVRVQEQGVDNGFLYYTIDGSFTYQETR